jgi:hypothetical protein
MKGANVESIYNCTRFINLTCFSIIISSVILSLLTMCIQDNSKDNLKILAEDLGEGSRGMEVGFFKTFLLAYISCARHVHWDISMYTYNGP